VGGVQDKLTVLTVLDTNTSPVGGKGATLETAGVLAVIVVVIPFLLLEKSPFHF
jgi:hypothetical protein